MRPTPGPAEVEPLRKFFQANSSALFKSYPGRGDSPQELGVMFEPIVEPVVV